jgi:hypothetical protein
MRRALPCVVVLAVVGASCGPAKDATSAGCPSGMAGVSVPGNDVFCIDRYEASLVEVDDDKPVSPFGAVKARSVRAVSRSGVVPQGYVSEVEASAACKASGKRLCAEDEWVAACRGERKTRFPYGDARKSGWCNDDGKSPLVRLYGSAGVRAFGEEPMNDPRLNQMPDTVARCGAYERCTNDLGVFDMVGNLHEWVDDPGGTFRGGYYLDTRRNGDGCDYRTTAHGAAYKDYSTGFRCCADKK